MLLSDEASFGMVGAFGVAMILFWCGCIKMLAVGFLSSYFWTASTCIWATPQAPSKHTSTLPRPRLSDAWP